MNDLPAVISAVNDDAILARDLAASPMISVLGAETSFYRGARCMGEAYNAGIGATTADTMVFAHQDVYFPDGWELRLADAIAEIAQLDPDWAVLGLVGATDDGRMAGRAWSSGWSRELTHPVRLPKRAQSLDELVLVVRRASGLRFDPDLPHFHLYGTDIVQQSLAAGFGAWIADAPVIHNSDQLTSLGAGYRKAYAYMADKWRDQLPIVTPICRLEAGRRNMLRKELSVMTRYLRQRVRGEPRRVGCSNPAEIARSLGYEHAAADPAHPARS